MKPKLPARRAATAIEYGLLAAGVGVLIFAAVASTGSSARAVFGNLAARLSAANTAATPGYVWAGGAWTLEGDNISDFDGNSGISGDVYTSPAASVYYGYDGAALEVRIAATTAVTIPVGDTTLTMPAGTEIDYNWTNTGTVSVNTQGTPAGSPLFTALSDLCAAQAGVCSGLSNANMGALMTEFGLPSTPP